MISIKKLQKEYIEIKKNRDPDDPMNLISFEVNESDWLKWNFTILGPYDSPYEGGIYTGIITFPENYPTSPPTVKFIEKIFHPNVYTDGKLCISILNERENFTGKYQDDCWRPVQNVESIFKSIISLLYNPNTDSAANSDASELLTKNPEAYYKKIRNDMDS
jgi:ubiquitin-protein ligase